MTRISNLKRLSFRNRVVVILRQLQVLSFRFLSTVSIEFKLVLG